MADPHYLVWDVRAWEDNAAELDEIMANMSTFSKSHVSLVSQAAEVLLRKASSSSSSSSGGRLNEYHTAICRVYAARSYDRNDVRFPYTIEKVRKHLANLREACKPVAALGLEEEHPRVVELAAMIEELER
jgi:hypothetical protein